MSSDDLEGDDIWGDSGGAAGSGAAAAAAGGGGGESKDDAGDEEMKSAEESLEDDDTRHMSISELRQRIHLINNDIRVMKSDVQRISHESRGQRDRIKENQERVKLNKQLPYLVANVVEVLEPDAEDGAFIPSAGSFVCALFFVRLLCCLISSSPSHPDGIDRFRLSTS